MADDTTQAVAQQVRAALAGADLDAFAALLDPAVTWGPPGDPTPPCRNREQVLAWYRHGRDEGRRAEVLDVTVHQDKILVAMTVTSPAPHSDDPPAQRWQVLTVADGRVSDIRGYDREAAARNAAGLGD